MQRGRSYEDLSIGNFIFIIRPVEAEFSKPTLNKRTLTLQKGMQTLGTLQECIPSISREKGNGLKHQFHPEEHSTIFRVINDKNLNYQWTVYDLLDGGEHQEIDCIQFSIQSFWKSFIEEYEKNVTNLNLRTKDEKDPKKMLEIWKQFLSESKQRNKSMRVDFAKANFALKFEIEARSDLDKQLQDYETQKVLRKLRQAQRSQIRRSAITSSNIGQQQFTQEQIKILQKIRKSKAQQGQHLSIPINLSPGKTYLQSIRQMNESVKNMQMQKELNQKEPHKTRLSDQPNQSLQIEDLINSVKKSTSLERGESLKENEREQNLQLSSKIKNQKSKVAINETSNKLEFSVQNVKMTIVYVLIGILMLWVLYNLMGHDSKVDYKKR